MNEILALQNKWWITKSVPYELLGEFKREIFPELVKDMKNKKITSIIGPRRVGKSILMHQLIEDLLKSGINEKRILYAQFDALQIRKPNIIKDLLDFVSEKNGEPLEELKETIYIFLDEVHKLETWSEEVKQFQDLKLKIKFVVSGSSSFRIVKGSGESLIGRINHFLLLPLNFREFLSVKGIKIDKINYSTLKKSYFNIIEMGSKLKIIFNEYLLKGGYPEIINERDFSKILIDYKDLSLQRDLFELEGVRDVKSIKDLLSVLASEATERLNYSKLGAILGIKADTVKRYIGLLEDIYLITESKVFSKKPYFAVRKERKVFFVDTGMLNAVKMINNIDENHMPKLVENACAKHIFFLKSKKEITPSITYWLDEFGKEIDLILETNGEIIPIEIKFKNKILTKDINTIKKFLERFNLKKGFVITKDTFEKKNIGGKEIFSIPAWLFLLIE